MLSSIHVCELLILASAAAVGGFLARAVNQGKRDDLVKALIWLNRSGVRERPCFCHTCVYCERKHPDHTIGCHAACNALEAVGAVAPRPGITYGEVTR